MNKRIITETGGGNVFLFADSLYEIQGHLLFQSSHDMTINIPSNCCLRFNCGSINFSLLEPMGRSADENADTPNNSENLTRDGEATLTLVGNDTVIEAGLFQIFGSNVILSGTWNVTTGYPEWWGAKSSVKKGLTTAPDEDDPDHRIIQVLKSNVKDCAEAIQNAFDSPIGHITFACGYYYVGNSIILRRNKAVTLQGRGQWRQLALNGARFSTVIWTDQNIDLLILHPVEDYKYMEGNSLTHDVSIGNIIIEGGALDVTSVDYTPHWITPNYTDYGKNYTKSAILIRPNGSISPKIATSLIGPITYYDSNDNVPFTVEDPKNNQCWGNGLRIAPIEPIDPSTPPNIIENNKLIQNSSAACRFYSGNLDLVIQGFGVGVRIDYQEDENNIGDVTSLKLNGLILGCMRPIYAPSRAFNGGEIACDIQTNHINHTNRNGGVVMPLVEGNMQEAYLDSFIWDIEYGDPMFKFSNTDHMRFGPRLISLLDRKNSAMGQSERREKVGNNYVFIDTNREIEYLSLTQLATLRGNATGHILGHLDPLQLGAGNAILQASDYIHTIDNDFLSIEQAMNGITINVASFDGTYDAQNNPNPLIEEISGSPFSPDGFLCNVLSFPQDENTQKNTTLTFTIGFHVPGFNAKLQYMALHFSGSGFIHFDNLKVTITGPNTNMMLFNGPYCNDTSILGLCDTIVPILPTNLDEAIFINSNNLIIELKGIRNGTSWWWSQDPDMQNLFKMSVEGRLNRHFNQLVWTAGGGAMGAHIMRHGKPYLLGTQQYPTLNSLPSDAAIGARGVVGSGDNLYPVIKTVSGWFVENLVGTDAQLATCRNTLGSLTVGQQAFNTETEKPVWWNGKYWE